jgi:hypothetical protein
MLRPRIAPPDTLFLEFPAKTVAVLHTFSGIAFSIGITPNGAFYVAM